MPADTPYTFKAIGVLRTPYKDKEGVPIQGAFDSDSLGTAEVFKDYAAGLQDIEGFSHLILLYLFHRSEGYDLICRPYMEDEEHGVFAMRAPKRPNPIGLSVVRLLRREGAVLQLSEMDMLDKTPLLDIKPYIPPFDHRKNVRLGWMDRAFRQGKFRKVSDDRF